MRERLAGRPTRANFRTGTLTVATLVPMRSVPHRVVCLLGLDDGVFPRAGAIDGDDVLARRPVHRRARPAQRGPPADARRDRRRDRAPRGHLHRRQRDDGPAAASRRTSRRAARHPRRHRGRRASSRPCATTRSRRSTRRNLDAADPFSFDTAALTGARAAAAPRAEPPSLADLVLPDRGDDVELAALVSFFKQPVKEFLRKRLEIVLVDEGEEVSDGLPVELDGLVAVGRRRPDAARPARRPDDGADPGQGVAARGAAAGTARLATREEARRRGRARRRARRLRSPRAGPRRPSTSTSTSAASAGCAAPSPTSTASGSSR